MASIIFKRHREPPVLLFLVILAIIQLSSCSVAAAAAALYRNRTSVGGGGMMSVHCRPDQATALLRLKRSFTIIANESACTLVSWRAGTDCCRWEGVHCRDADGRVTSLDLGECGLQSPALDPAIFSLTSLRHLDLAWNDFNGSQLPLSGFEHLAELRHLNLSSSSFDGHIPVGIGGLTNLVSLDLSTTVYVVQEFDDFGEYDIWHHYSSSLLEPNIASLVANLSNLRELNLDWVDLSGNGDEWCASFANSTTPQLQVLSLRHCHLDGPVCGSLSSIPSLTMIDLQYNRLRGPIPEFLADLPSLSVLRLTNNDLQGQFPTRIFQNRNLTSLDIRYNSDISGSLPNFSSDSRLANLLVSNTNFSGPIPSSLGNLKSLTVLGLAATDFVQELPSSIGELTSLYWFEVTGAGVVGSIPSWVTNLTSLVRLQFSSCGLSGHIPSSIGNLKNLTWLALYNCNFSGPIPPQLFNLTQLSNLYLHSNKFMGSVELISFLELPDLDGLNLSDNILSVIVGEYNSSWAMRLLGLASCNLSSFPVFLRNIYHIRYLDLSDNQIHGAIPRWAWEEWDAMLVLDLSYNQFSSIEHDSIPLTDVTFLDLSFNLIEGPLPIPGPDTEMFDFSNNRFSSIPNNFGSPLISISYLNAMSNNLSGQIPRSICNARGLEFLDLSYNNLSGPIPSCLMEDIHSLGVLNLQANQIHGELPHNMKQGCALEEINLSNNRIEGQLPRSIVACGRLQILDIGNNRINDTFPCWMSTLPELQVLVLESNKFFGHVGPSTVGNKENHCEFMKLRILSLASNGFYGTLPNNWFKSFSSMAVEPTEDGTLLMKNHFGQYQQTYQFTTAITYKGSTVTFSKILKTLVIIDVSDNAFHGAIPESIGELVLLCGLNMSHNTLTGTITSKLSDLHQLESLDLSSNGLHGEIPKELAWLDFLSVLNLSYNQLVGRIPPGSPHFQTFSNLSFMGNTGLCGPPLSKQCDNSAPNVALHHSDKDPVDVVLFLFIGVGFGVGFAVTIVVVWGIRIRKRSQGYITSLCWSKVFCI
uniref:Uncharacterized protein n=1 Tax=Avena sativa TaxID=4498 RepID=A0ACD5TRT7_AVESA